MPDESSDQNEQTPAPAEPEPIVVTSSKRTRAEARGEGDAAPDTSDSEPESTSADPKVVTLPTNRPWTQSEIDMLEAVVKAKLEESRAAVAPYSSTDFTIGG